MTDSKQAICTYLDIIELIPQFYDEEKKTEQSSILKEIVEKKLENGSGKDFKLKK